MHCNKNILLYVFLTKKIDGLDVKYFNCIFITMRGNLVNRTDVPTDKQRGRPTDKKKTAKHIYTFIE